MKKFLAYLITLLLIVGIFSACSQASDSAALAFPQDAKVQTVNISSLPDGYSYSFSGDEADTIVDYLSALNLISDFPENPNEYSGMTWVITIAYEDQECVTVYHFGNLFVRTEDGPWYKLDFDEAAEFDTLLEDLAK